MKVVPIATTNNDQYVNEFPVQLLDIYKELGYKKHGHLRDRFEPFLNTLKGKDYRPSYKTVTYVSNGQKSYTIAMSLDFAMMFGIWVDPSRSQFLIEKAKEAETLKIQLLEAQIAKLENQPPKILAVSSKVNRRHIHTIRKELHHDGVCDHITETVTHHYFPVNEHGESLGYRNIGKGKHKTIDIYHNSKDD